MTDVHKLITDNIDVWTSAIKSRKTQGRGTNSKTELAGIKKLRALILELAVNGKLIPQSTSDESASILLEKISEEKAQLIADKKIKKQKVLPAISLDEIPFELPVGWEWSKLGDLIYRISNGFSGKQNKDGEGYPLTRIETISNSNINLDKLGYSPSIPDEKLEYYKLLKNDILLSHINSDYHVGKTAIYSSDRTIYHGVNLILIRLSPLMSPLFCDLVINQLRLSGYFLSIAQHAIGQSSINQTKIIDIPIPSPPLAEQHRIVAKVDELMALCDQLEQQTEQSLTAHQTLVEVLLNALFLSPVEGHAETNSEANTAADIANNTELNIQEQAQVNVEDEFQENWQRIADHFDVLFTTEASIDQLKQTILQLAVMGKLVPQNPSDEPASKLLEKIAKEKSQLIADKKIKKQKPLPAITDEEKPFELPSSWEWCNLSELFAIVTDGDHQAPPKANSGVPFLVIGNLNTGNVVLDGCRFVPEEYYEKLDWSRKPTKGDLLYTVTGSYGIPVKISSKEEFCVQRHVAILKASPSSPIKYLTYLFQSKYSYEYATEVATGIAQKTVPLTGLRKMPASLPPLAEQHRIVAKVDELLALCDQLKTRLADAQITQLHLADSVVENALN